MAEERMHGNLTLAEAEQDHGGDPTTTICPEDFNELLRCLGTYCALLNVVMAVNGE